MMILSLFDSQAQKNPLRDSSPSGERISRASLLKPCGFNTSATGNLGFPTPSLFDSQAQKNPLRDSFVPGERIELSTQGFSVLCSTTELPRPAKIFPFGENLGRRARSCEPNLSTITVCTLRDSNSRPSRCKRDALTN